MWIWENYISENRKEKWLEIGEKLRHINDHVLEDIEDFIIIEGFKPKTEKDKKAIEDLVNAMKQEKYLARKKAKEDTDRDQDIEKMRKFMDKLRPPFVWNFFYDGEEEIPHELRPYCDPRTCY